jgi:hypothetical protein
MPKRHLGTSSVRTRLAESALVVPNRPLVTLSSPAKWMSALRPVGRCLVTADIAGNRLCSAVRTAVDRSSVWRNASAETDRV